MIRCRSNKTKGDRRVAGALAGAMNRLADVVDGDVFYEREKTPDSQPKIHSISSNPNANKIA